MADMGINGTGLAAASPAFANLGQGLPLLEELSVGAGGLMMCKYRELGKLWSLRRLTLTGGWVGSWSRVGELWANRCESEAEGCACGG